MNPFDFQLIRRKMVKTAKESIRKRETSSQVYENMQEVFIEMDKSPLVSTRLIIQCSGKRKIKIQNHKLLFLKTGSDRPNSDN